MAISSAPCDSENRRSWLAIAGLFVDRRARYSTGRSSANVGGAGRFMWMLSLWVPYVRSRYALIHLSL
jgi:hypothetical protein